jgi:dihydrofolate reductase
MTEVFKRPAAFLLGRKTYEIFAAYWPKVTAPADTIAAALNTLPKHVASKTLDKVEWQGSALVRDVVREVAELKKRYAGELQVHGSGNLAQTLIANDLVDEYNLLSFPIILGKGKRLFAGGTPPQAFKLVATRTSPSGVVMNTYRRSGSPTYGTF